MQGGRGGLRLSKTCLCNTWTLPYLKEETKLLIEERGILKEEMTRIGDLDLSKEVKRLSNEIAKAIENRYF